MQTSLNISEQFNYDSYAIDAVMALALALSETYNNNSLTNLSLQRALEEVMFSGASVSYYPGIVIILSNLLIL